MPEIKRNKKWILIIICLICVISARSQAPFSRGLNLTGWFQVNNPGQIHFTKFTKKDLINIKSFGCDVIRLPIDMHAMTSGSLNYTLDPLYFSFLDSVVKWCEQLELYLILDNHSFDPNTDTSPEVVDILIKVWSQMASHYKNRSKYILYEILNEPHGISTSTWGTIQNQAINAIRASDTKHTVIVGGSGYNTYTELKNLPLYSDTNLLYTFHFYDPFMFTHQGATWVSPSMAPLAGVPFPYNSSEMPVCPASLKGTWIESGLISYPSDGTVSHVKLLIDNAVNFRNSRNVKIFCGEFGVYIPNSDDADRCYWYKVVRDYLEEKNIPWTIWDYKGGFGLFNKGSNEFFEHDLNVRLLDSLGFVVPAQVPFSVQPDSTGFPLYTDYIGVNINDASYGAGTINFYSDNLPNNDNYCISWNGFNQYNTIGFNFVPDKDLTQLVSENYAIDFIVRGSETGIKFDIRFVDTKSEQTGDHPWRMGTTIDASDATWDRKWQHAHIPLSTLAEQGSWDVDTWYNPEGKFDWTKVDKLEISTEYTDIIGKSVWFDNIFITNMDTARIWESGTVSIEKIPGNNDLDLSVNPNPVRYYAIISYNVPKQSRVTVNIFSGTGYKIRCLSDEIESPGHKSLEWDLCNDNRAPVPKGIYFVQVKTHRNSTTGKIIRY